MNVLQDDDPTYVVRKGWQRCSRPDLLAVGFPVDLPSCVISPPSSVFPKKLLLNLYEFDQQ
jgi:hypothetical protein